jgi:hypothetical protein
MLTIEIKNKVLEQVALGLTLRFICKTNSNISYSEVKKELKENEEFALDFSEAKKDYADQLIQEMINIADAEDLDVKDKMCRIDTRKWVALLLKESHSGLTPNTANYPAFNVIMSSEKENCD